jgi:hypothetical protein
MMALCQFKRKYKLNGDSSNNLRSCTEEFNTCIYTYIYINLYLSMNPLPSQFFHSLHRVTLGCLMPLVIMNVS